MINSFPLCIKSLNKTKTKTVLKLTKSQKTYLTGLGVNNEIGSFIQPASWKISLANTPTVVIRRLRQTQNGLIWWCFQSYSLSASSSKARNEDIREDEKAKQNCAKKIYAAREYSPTRSQIKYNIPLWGHVRVSMRLSIHSG